MGMIELGRMREAQKRHLPQPGYNEEKLLPVVSRLSLEGWRGVTKVTKQRTGVWNKYIYMGTRGAQQLR